MYWEVESSSELPDLDGTENFWRSRDTVTCGSHLWELWWTLAISFGYPSSCHRLPGHGRFFSLPPTEGSPCPRPWWLQFSPAQILPPANKAKQARCGSALLRGAVAPSRLRRQPPQWLQEPSPEPIWHPGAAGYRVWVQRGHGYPHEQSAMPA